MRFRKVLFDCDGVVVDSERLSNTVLRDDLAERGLDLPLRDIMDLFVGGTIEGAGREAAKRGAQIPDTWLSEVYAKIYDLLSREVTLIPGITEVLDALDAAGIPYAMGSNGSVEKMQITLGKTGLLERFEGRLYSGQELGAPKPAPDVYLKAAGDVPASACVVIEDSASGAKAAKAAGMACFGFTYDTEPARLDGLVTEMFDDMAHLPAMLGLTKAVK
ncbi:MAG: HAD-IA family hydrolase [Pseudomonadota bacterium]